MQKFLVSILSVCISLLGISVIWAKARPYEWLHEEKFLGIRCGFDDDSLLSAKEMGLNTVFVNAGFVLEPNADSYPQSMADLRHASKLAKELGLHFFIGWHVLDSKVREIVSSQEVTRSRGFERDKTSELCLSDPIYWDYIFADPMMRVTKALAGPEYKLDGFLLDIENYARRQVQWTGKCVFATHSMDAVRSRVETTRKALQTVKSGLLFGMYPIRPKIKRPVLKAWLQGFSDTEQPVLLLAEYTYEGYRPEWELEKKSKVYRERIGNPVVLVPGFNFLKIPEPSAWKMHLYSFAKVTDGYWLYPGNRLIREVDIKSSDGELTYASIREANEEIERLRQDPMRKSHLDYRRQRPDEVDKDQLKSLLALAREVEPIAASAENLSKARRAVLQTSDVELLVMAGSREPLDLSVKGKGYLAVYDRQGSPLFFEDFDYNEVRVDLSVKSQGVYPVIIKDTSGKGARISIANRYWSFRGTHVWTVGGRKARFLVRPRQSPLYFYVPKGTRFFRMFISDPKRGSFAVIKSPDGKKVLKQKGGFLKGDREHARQDVEISVPFGQDGKVWSVEGTSMSGLPRLVIYGVPDLFNPDPERLLILDDKALAIRRSVLDRKRIIKKSGATYMWIEAEELQGGPWRLSRAVAGTSGEGAMFAKGFRSTLPLYGYISVPHSKKWRIWVRGLLGSEGSRKRALRVEIDGVFSEWTHTKATKEPEFAWENAGTFKLENGNVLKVHSDKAGRPSVDAIVLTDNLKWIPVGVEKP